MLAHFSCACGYLSFFWERGNVEMSCGSALPILHPGASGDCGGRKSPGEGTSELAVAGPGLPSCDWSGRFCQRPAAEASSFTQHTTQAGGSPALAGPRLPTPHAPGGALQALACGLVGDCRDTHSSGPPCELGGEGPLGIPPALQGGFSLFTCSEPCFLQKGPLARLPVPCRRPLFWYPVDDCSCTSQKPQPWHLRLPPESCQFLLFHPSLLLFSLSLPPPAPQFPATFLQRLTFCLNLTSIMVVCYLGGFTFSSFLAQVTSACPLELSSSMNSSGLVSGSPRLGAFVMLL